ncbi:MAG: DUF5615 family PIN-like protein [Bacteroidota bacterium]
MGVVRFYVDEHVSKAVVEGLRRRGIEVVRLTDVDKLGDPDDDHLDFARREGLVVFTQDADFLRLASAGAEHAGIVYAPQGTSVGDVVRGLLLVAHVLTAEEMVGHVEYL